MEKIPDQMELLSIIESDALKLMDEIDDYKKQIKIENECIKTLEENTREEMRQIETIDKEVNDMNEEIDHCERHLMSIKGTNQCLKQTNDELIDVEICLKTAFIEKQQSIAATMEQYNETRAHYAQLWDEYCQCYRETTELGQDYDEKRNAFKTLESEIIQLEETINQMEAELFKAKCNAMGKSYLNKNQSEDQSDTNGIGTNVIDGSGDNRPLEFKQNTDAEEYASLQRPPKAKSV